MECQSDLIDVDSTQRRVYGYARQSAAVGHTKIQGKTVLVRGLNALTATICTPDPAPVVAAARLRGGNAKHCPRRRVADHPGDRDRAGCRVYRDRDRADGLRLLQRRSVPRRGPGRGVLLGHLPDGPRGQGGSRVDQR